MDSTQIVYVRKTIDWLLSQCFNSGNLRSSLGSNDDKLIHWCHGAPGAIYMFLEAHAVIQCKATTLENLIFHIFQLFGGRQYLDAAIKSADVIWERGILRKSYSLCHGVAGNAYALMAIYEQTKVSNGRQFSIISFDLRSSITKGTQTFGASSHLCSVVFRLRDKEHNETRSTTIIVRRIGRSVVHALRFRWHCTEISSVSTLEKFLVFTSEL